MRFHCPFFVLYINLVHVLNFKPECPKHHILISLLIHISLWQTYLLWIPTSSCLIFIVVSPAMLFGTSNNLMCHIFLILSYVYISCLNHIFLSYYFLLTSVQLLSHRQCLLPHPTHHHKRHLSMADTPTTKQNNTSNYQLTSPLCCSPAAPLLPATSLTSRSLLAACRPWLVLAIAARHLVSHPALINALPTVWTK